MADNVPITPGSGKIIATDEVGGINYQIVKLAIGVDDSIIKLDAGSQPAAGSFPVYISPDQTKVPVDQVTSAYGGVATITRPADTTAYAVGDVVGGVISIPSVGPNAGAILINGTRFEYDAAALNAGSFGGLTLALYSATPPSALADNAPWTLPSGDRSVFVGLLDIGTPLNYGATFYVETNNIGKQLKLATTGLWAYLITKAAFTGNSADVMKFNMHSVAV